MKKVFVYILLMVASSAVCAQGCYSTKSTAGTKLYKQGRYSEARALFVEAKSCSDGPTNSREMDLWIKKCDEKLTGHNSAPTNNTTSKQSSSQAKKSTEKSKQTNETENYLSVSSKELFFSSFGGTKSIDVYCNAEWEVSVAAAYWAHLSRNGNKITLNVDANKLTVKRTDYFVLKSGSKTCTVNLTQEGVTPYISASSTSLHYKTEGGTQTIHISSNCEWNVLVPPAYWVKLTRSGNVIYLNALPNTSGNSRSDYFTLMAGGQRIRINITQEYVKPHGLFVKEERFSSNFINFHGAYNITDEEAFVGLSYSFINSHLGFRLSGYKGVGYSEDSYIATFDPVFRLTNDNSALDFQLYIGGGVFNGNPIGEAGVRFAWRNSRNLSLWDFGFGGMATKDGDVIPTLGLGVAIPFAPVVGVGALLAKSPRNGYYFYDFSSHFLDVTMSINSNWGISYSYIPHRSGWYVTTLFDDGVGAITGPVLRVVSPRSKVDVQVYGGIGYFDGLAYDFGARVAPPQNRTFSWWDFSTGITVIENRAYFTVGGSLCVSSIVGFFALVGQANP